MQTAFLFDLDGVLIDTEPQYTAFWGEMGRRYFPETTDFSARIKGSTLTQIFDSYFPDDTALQAEVTEALNGFERTMDFPFVDGALDFLTALRKKGIPAAVVTSSNQAKMAQLFARYPEFPSLFNRIFTAEDAMRSKPAPDCYIGAARYFGLAPQQCVVFEDSLSGLRAARASEAGLVVGLTTTMEAEKIVGLCNFSIPNFVDFTPEQALPADCTL